MCIFGAALSKISLFCRETVRIFAIIWLHLGHILVIFWLRIDYILAMMYWQHWCRMFGCISAAFLLYFCAILTVFLLYQSFVHTSIFWAVFKINFRNFVHCQKWTNFVEINLISNGQRSKYLTLCANCRKMFYTCPPHYSARKSRKKQI